MSKRELLSYAAYDLASVLGALAALPFLLPLALTSRGRHLSERLGMTPAAARQLIRPLWIHAASVGEVLAAEPLVRQLRLQCPDIPVLLSTTSLTGRETALQRSGADAVMLLPADVSFIVHRVMRRLRPRCLVIVETELWPALLRSAAQQRIPVVMVSGRVSPRAAARYARIRWLTRAMLAALRVCAMQSEGDAARIVALGALAERVHVIGSLKFARHAAARLESEEPTKASLLSAGRVLLVAASTHPGEEDLVLGACAKLWALHPEMLLLIAPRRPERFEEVAELLGRSGLSFERRSQLDGALRSTTQVLLLDSVGELLDFFPASRAVFVGGTIAPVGGHNVIEPALFGKAAAFGPQTANVAAGAEALLAAGAATRVNDAVELEREWLRQLNSPELSAEMGERGRAAVAVQADVAERSFALLRPYLGLPE